MIVAHRKNPHAVALARRGAKKGGEVRAAKLSPEKRREIAQKAALTRWSRVKQGEDEESWPTNQE